MKTIKKIKIIYTLTVSFYDGSKSNPPILSDR